MTAAPFWRSCTIWRWPRALPTASWSWTAAVLLPMVAPRDVLTPERIATVFGVEAVMADDAAGAIPILRKPL